MLNVLVLHVSTLKPSCWCNCSCPQCAWRSDIMKPIAGIVGSTSPSVSLQKIVVSPAVSSLTVKIVISVLPTNRSRVLVVRTLDINQLFAMDEHVAPWSLLLRVSQHVIEPGPRLSRESTDACAAVMDRPERSSGRLSHPRSPRVWPTRPGLAAKIRFVFRVPVVERLLLGRSIGQRVSQLSQLSCLLVTAFKLRRPFALSFSSICLFKSVLLGAVSSGP